MHGFQLRNGSVEHFAELTFGGAALRHRVGGDGVDGVVIEYEVDEVFELSCFEVVELILLRNLCG